MNGGTLYAAGTRGRVSRGASSPTRGLLDGALNGMRLARGRTGGETDGMRGGGPLDPDSRAGRYLRLRGWIVAPGHPTGLAPDQVTEAFRAAGIIGAGAGVDDALDAYARLAMLAEREGSATAARDDARSEAAWWRGAEQSEADRIAREAAVREHVRAALWAWLDRLTYGPKQEYAAALVAAWDGAAVPADPGTAWAIKARARFAYVVRAATLEAEGAAA